MCEGAASRLITADFHRLVCLSLPVVVSEQFEYARWGWLPLPAPPTSASTTATPSSASAASSPEHGGSGAAQCQRQRGGRSVQHACSYGSKRPGGDTDAGAAALSAHGGKARGCPQQLCLPGLGLRLKINELDKAPFPNVRRRQGGLSSGSAVHFHLPFTTETAGCDRFVSVVFVAGS